MKDNFNKIWAVVLAAGKGKRINAHKSKNKVTYDVKGVPMISRTVKIIHDAGIKNILVVVGFAKESVLKLLDEEIRTVEQKKRLGTGHALKIALKKIPQDAENILVLNGDDSFLYSSKILNNLIETHINNNSKITFLTIEVSDPSGLGRVVRNINNEVVDIVEDKDATLSDKEIKEINPACYIFSIGFLKKYIKRIERSRISKEYYITSLVKLAVENSEKIETLKLTNMKWRGVNTIEELNQAQEII